MRLEISKYIYMACILLLIITQNTHAQIFEFVNEAPVVLPEYRVTLSRLDIEHEPWLYTAWNDIEIISSTDYETTDDFLQHMKRRLFAIGAATPGIRPRAMLPFGIILHGSGPTRKQLYLQNWKPLSRMFIADQGGRQIIGIQADPKSDKTSESLGLTKERGAPAANHYFFNRLDQYYPPLPRWYAITIREIIQQASLKDYENFSFGTFVLGNFKWDSREWQNTHPDDDKMYFWRRGGTGSASGTPAGMINNRKLPVGIRSGKIPTKSSDDIFSFNNWDSELRREKIKSQMRKKQRVRPMPMARMFAGIYDDSIRIPGYPANFWQRQCYAFWHYCCVRQDAGALKQGYMKLVEKSADSPVTEEVFRECMGMGFADMEEAIFQYVGAERAKQGHGTLEILFKVGAFSREVPLRKATQAEIARIKGECLAFQGKHDLARKTMLSVYDRKKADPALCGALGVLEYQAGDLEKARLLLTAAIQLKLPNPEVYRTLARIKLDDALGIKKGQKPRPDKRLTPGQASEIYALLQAIRQMPPIRVETYELLNELLLYTDNPPAPEQKTFIEEGKRWFPEGKNPAPYPWRKISLAAKKR